MATHDYVIDNSTGANVRADINLVLQAILTNNSSSSAPSTTAAYMWWADTTNGVLKIRNSSNNDWVELLQLDGTLTLEDGSASTPALAFRDDLNTGIFSSGDNKINFTTGGTEKFELGATTIFNENGEDIDFRIEGDTDANNFYLDAGNDAIGIGTSTPLTPDGSNADNPNNGKVFTIFGGSPAINLTHNTSGGSAASSDYSAINFGRTGSSTNPYRATIGYKQSDDILRINANNIIAFDLGTIGTDEKARFDSSGRLLLGTTTEGHDNADDLTIATSGNTGITIRSGTSSAGNIYFSDATSGDAEFDGYISYAQSVNKMFFGVNQANRVVIDSSGQVGIGTTSPDQKLVVADTSSVSLIRVTANNAQEAGIDFGDTDDNDIGRIRYDNSVNAMRFFVNAAERMRIDSSGNMLLGRSSIDFAKRLNIQGPSGTQISVSSADTTSGSSGTGSGIEFRYHTGSAETACDSLNLIKENGTSGDTACALTFKTKTNGGSPTERMRIDSSGRVFVGTTNTAPHTDGSGIVIHPTAGVLVGVKDTHAGIFARHDSDGECIRFQRANTDVGSIDVSSSSTSYNTSSDYRLKENVVAISDGITRLKTLKPSRFNFIADATKTVDGFLAHEVTAVPEAITGTKDEVDSDNNPVYQGIDQSKLVPLLVAAVQELITKVETLEAA